MKLFPVTTDKQKEYLAAFLVALLAFLIFLPALHNGFVNWDDDDYIYDNPFIRSINPSFFKWAFFDFAVSNWHPLTWISHAVDYALWGLNPLGHHLTSILFHALNTFFVALISIRLLKQARTRAEAESGSNAFYHVLAGAVTGLLFGIHPVHVESVAWISERKDVLSAFFYLLSILVYLDYVKTGPGAAQGNSFISFFSKKYTASLFFFMLAVMSKPMAVTLPVTLLILDWFPLRRVAGFGNCRRIFSEKIPFFGVAAAAGILTIMAQAGEAIVSFDVVPLSTRILVAFRSILSYLSKIVLPGGLIPLYPYPKDVALGSLKYLLPVLIITGVTAASIVFLRRREYFALWSYYLVTLLPVIGIIQVAGQSMADRYTYLPSIAPFLLCGAAVAFFYYRISRTYILLVPGLLLISALVLVSQQQIHIWENGGTLWSREVEQEPNYSPGYTLRAQYYTETGRFAEALQDIHRAMALSPASPVPNYSRGMLLAKHGLFSDALADFDEAVAKSRYEDFRFYKERAGVYAQMGRYDKALKDYTVVLQFSPGRPEIYAKRGKVFDRLGKYREAVEDYTAAIRITPLPDKEIFRNRGNSLLKMGLRDNAALDFKRAEE